MIEISIKEKDLIKIIAIVTLINFLISCLVIYVMWRMNRVDVDLARALFDLLDHLK